MKKLLPAFIRLALAGGLALCGGSASAAPLTPDEALGNLFANSPIRISASERNRITFLRADGKQDSPALYLFNMEKGFLVVSADDEIPALLGYSDTGRLPADTSQTAPAFRYWISTMASRIDYRLSSEAYTEARKGSRRMVIAKVARPQRDPVATLCATRWNQDAPYNNMCPLSGSRRTYTGCVATAMSQVMKYHNWPETGEGSNEYAWGSTTLSSDFSSHSYDWNSMLNVYTPGSYSSTEGNAVAQLMSDAGISVNMGYSTSGSGAVSMNIAGALGRHFRYDKSSLRFYKREYFGLLEWEEMIYKSPKEDGPVIYNGQSTEGGHSFICDGYSKDGYFHFNWGWGGVSDGYFLLDALDPYTQGIGGSASNTGFNFMQDIVAGIRPARNGDSGRMTASFIASNGFSAEVKAYQRYGVVLLMDFGEGLVYNMGPGEFPAGGEIAVKYEPAAGGEAVYDAKTVGEDVKVMYGFRQWMAGEPSELPDGKYKVTLAYREKDADWRDVAMPLSAPRYMLMTKAGEDYAFEEGGLTLLEGSIKSFPIELDMKEVNGSKVAFKAVADVRNPSAVPFYSTLCGVLLKESGEDYSLVAIGDDIIADFEAGESKELSYESPFTGFASRKGVAAGDYHYCLCTTSADGTQIYPVTEPVAVKVVDPTSGITDIDTDITDTAKGETRYVGIDGRSVASPAPGSIVIRLNGKRAEKIFVRSAGE